MTNAHPEGWPLADEEEYDGEPGSDLEGEPDWRLPSPTEAERREILAEAARLLAGPWEAGVEGVLYGRSVVVTVGALPSEVPGCFAVPITVFPRSQSASFLNGTPLSAEPAEQQGRPVLCRLNAVGQAVADGMPRFRPFVVRLRHVAPAAWSEGLRSRHVVTLPRAVAAGAAVLEDRRLEGAPSALRAVLRQEGEGGPLVVACESDEGLDGSLATLRWRVTGKPSQEGYHELVVPLQATSSGGCRGEIALTGEPLPEWAEAVEIEVSEQPWPEEELAEVPDEVLAESVRLAPVGAWPALLERHRPSLAAAMGPTAELPSACRRLAVYLAQRRGEDPEPRVLNRMYVPTCRAAVLHAVDGVDRTGPEGWLTGRARDGACGLEGQAIGACGLAAVSLALGDPAPVAADRFADAAQAWCRAHRDPSPGGANALEGELVSQLAAAIERRQHDGTVRGLVGELVDLLGRAGWRHVLALGDLVAHLAGEEAAPGRVHVRVHAPLDAGPRGGCLATLELEITGDQPAGLYPDPVTMAFLSTDGQPFHRADAQDTQQPAGSFQRQLTSAWRSLPAASGRASVAWRLHLRGEPVAEVVGHSLGLACAVGLRWLLGARAAELREGICFTGGVALEGLIGVDGYPNKLAAIGDWTLVLPADDVAHALAVDPTRGGQLVGVKNIDQAYEEALGVIVHSASVGLGNPEGSFEQAAAAPAGPRAAAAGRGRRRAAAALVAVVAVAIGGAGVSSLGRDSGKQAITLQPAAAIVSPANGASLQGAKATVRGTLAHLPSGYRLWLVVQPDQSSGFYPQEASVSEDGSWTRVVFFGEAETKTPNEGFTLLAVLADPAASAGFQAYLDGRSNAGLATIQGTELASVHVSRSS